MRPHIFVLLCVLTALLCVHVAQAAYCHNRPVPPSPPNEQPIYSGSPELVRSVANGKLMMVGPAGDRINVLHLYGTAKEMGFAHGQLMHKEIQELLPVMYEHMYKQIDGSLDFLPKDIRHLVEKYGLEAALDLVVDATRPWTPQYWFDEIEGLAEGAQVDARQLRNLQYIGELLKGSCSMLGVWGDSLAPGGYNRSATMLQLRALDWDMEAPVINLPALVVYHPNDPKYPQLHEAVNVAFVGFVGGLTGVSIKQLGISEIGVYFSDDTFGSESRFGEPFNALIKDILLVDNTLEDSITRIQNTKRTCDLILGVGDAKAPGNDSFRAFQYSASVANVFSDQNQQPTAEWHPRIPNMVYYAMDWQCPAQTQAMANQLKQLDGQLSVETIIRDVAPKTLTGDTHICVYDMANWNMFCAHARQAGVNTGSPNAYLRTYIHHDMRAMFAETL